MLPSYLSNLSRCVLETFQQFIHFAIHSVPTVVSYVLQLLAMAIFSKCPVCGELAFVQPEMGDKEHRAFKCENGHEFKKALNKDVKEVEDKEIWDHMPEWAGCLNMLKKNDVLQL